MLRLAAGPEREGILPCGPAWTWTAQEVLQDGSSPAHAQGDRRLAGRQHVATFEQIADFCKLHPLEVKGIADGEVAAGIKGLDPVANGQLTREEIEKARREPRLPAEDLRAQGEAAADQADQEGPPLHAGVAPPGPARTPSSGSCATIRS